MDNIQIKIFEAPMCCPTGVCGPDVDDTLIELDDSLKQLKKEGVVVERNSMNHNPMAFQENQSILNIVNTKGIDDLPITQINGKVIKLGEYPSPEELRAEIDNLREEE